MAALALPFFNALAGKSLALPIDNVIFWAILIALTGVLGLLSGAYPAFFMSKFTPALVLKNRGNGRRSSGLVRNGLVVFQFAISVFLIVCTLVVFRQIDYIQSKDLGYRKDRVLVIEDVDAAGTQLQSFKEEVQQIGKVERVSLSSFLPTPSRRKGTTFFQEGKLFDTRTAMIIENWDIDYDYLATLDLELVAGRNFDLEFSNDSSAVLLNESAVEMLGVSPEEALGKRITNDFRNPDAEKMKFYTIVGVVQNFHFETLRNTIDAMSLVLGKDANRMIVKLNAGDFSNSIAQIERLWKTFAAGQPFNHYFLDDAFNEVYRAEENLGQIFAAFTLLSIFVACLGLLGLSAYSTTNRVKEIGIRKVLGASVGQITFRLVFDFVRLVGVAVLIAIPVSAYAMNLWLEDFSYRTDVAWWIFGLAAVLAIVISLATLSYQSIRAAVANPVRSLGSE